MKRASLVSVVVATCNGARYLSEQLGSVLGQTHENLEVIISDDCSGDETLAIAREFAKKDARIRILSNSSRLGVTGNFLQAIGQAKGEFVAFCDQDDVWRRDKVEILRTLLEERNDNMLAYSDLEVCDESLRGGGKSFWRISRIRPVEGALDERILLRNLAPGCSMLFRKEVKEKLAGFSSPVPIMHDHLVFAVSCMLGRVVFTRSKLVEYRQHHQNVIGVSNAKKFDRDSFFVQLKARLDFFSRYYAGTPRFNLERLALFCDSGTKKKAGQLLFLRYYLFIHPATFKGQILGTLECLCPGFYSTVKRSFSL